MALPNIVALFLYFLLLSFLAIGGLPTVLPEMHRYVVEVHHWMTSQQFATAYALAQVAPGPNVMYITLIGWQVAGWAGAAATTLALLGPVSTLTVLVGRTKVGDGLWVAIDKLSDYALPNLMKKVARHALKHLS